MGARRAGASPHKGSQAVCGGASEWGRRPGRDSLTPQRLGSIEVPAIRGEEELVQVSQQQLPGAPGEGCQVPGGRQGRGIDQRLRSTPPPSERQ